MKKQDLIECIKIGFIDGTNDRLNEDNADYEEEYGEDLPIEGNEAQSAYEFGIMMAKEEMNLEESEMVNYLEEILYDSNSNLTVNDLD